MPRPPASNEPVVARVVSVVDTLAPAPTDRLKLLRLGAGWLAITGLVFAAVHHGWGSLLARGEGFGHWLGKATVKTEPAPTMPPPPPGDFIEPRPVESKREGTSPTPGRQKAQGAVAQPTFAGSLRVSAETILRLANAGYVPKGHEVPGALGCPAGVQLDNVSVLGLGVAEGDVVVSVNGVATPTAADAVSAVLSARARRARAIGVRLWRGGALHFVQIEMPYVDSRGALIDPGELDQ